MKQRAIERNYAANARLKQHVFRRKHIIVFGIILFDCVARLGRLEKNQSRLLGVKA
jgi:hypothetical protein